MTINVVSEKVKFRHAERTLSFVDDEAVLGKAFEELSKMGKVFVCVAAKDEEIIDVRKAERQASGDCVYKPLECLSGVTEPEGHPEVFKKAERCYDSSLGNVRGFDRYLMIRLDLVNLRKDGCSMQWCCEVRDIRKWVAIRNGALFKAR